MLEQLKQNYVFAVIRGKTSDDALEISRQAIAGGIKNIEVTFSTPDATKVIAQLSQEFAERDDVVIGAGTVMSTELAEVAILAGAKFLVSPHFSVDIQKVAQKYDNLYFPGCATATEISQAIEAGCPIIKLFPGGQLGTGFIKDIHGPLPQVDLMPSGGVSIDNVAEWKKAGACAVGVGSALSSKVSTEGYESVRDFAERFMKALED